MRVSASYCAVSDPSCNMSSSRSPLMFSDELHGSSILAMATAAVAAVGVTSEASLGGGGSFKGGQMKVKAK